MNMSDFMVFFLTLEMAFFRQKSAFRMEISTFQDSKVESAWHGESCESHEGGSC